MAVIWQSGIQHYRHSGKERMSDAKYRKDILYLIAWVAVVLLAWVAGER